jgi:hypothetical protein
MGAVLDDRELLDYESKARESRDRWPEFAAIARLELGEWWLKRNAGDRASSVLEWPPQPGSQYALRFQVALAQVEQAKGDAQRAQDLFAQASHMASELEIPFRYEMETAKAASTPLRPDHQLDLWTVQPNLMQAEFRASGGPPIGGTFDLRRLALLRSIEESNWRQAYGPLANRAALRIELNQLIPITLESRVRDNLGLDLRIAFSEADYLAALPWEWADLDAFRFVYRGARGVDAATARWQSLSRWFTALGIDAGLGSPSQEAITLIEDSLRKAGQFVDSWNGPETRRRLALNHPRAIAIIKLEQEVERSASFSYGQRGISVEHLYEEQNRKEPNIVISSFDPRYLGPDGMVKIASQFEILHICLPVTELSGSLQLSVPSDDTVAFSPAFLNQPSFPRLPPIVILDVPRPPRSEFWAQQLVWRNLFARQLFEQSPVEAVICAGLAEDSDTYLKTLIHHVESHSPLGEVVKALNQIPQMAASLYASDPTMPC